MGRIQIDQKKNRLIDTVYNYLYDGLFNGTSDFMEWCEDEIKEGKISLDQVEQITVLAEQLQNDICENM
jgi:hypothetical protein